MATNNSNLWKQQPKDEADSSATAAAAIMEAEHIRQQLTMARAPSMVGSSALSPLELALLQQKTQYPTGTMSFSPRIPDERLVAAAAAAANSDYSLALAAGAADPNAAALQVATAAAASGSLDYNNRISPLERHQLNELNAQSNVLSLSLRPTMTSPFAAHMQLAQRAFQQQREPNPLSTCEPSAAAALLNMSPLMASLVEAQLTRQNQAQLMQRQHQLLLQLGSDPNSMASSPALPNISNLEILQYLQQQNDLQTSMMIESSKALPVAAAPPAPTTAPALPPSTTAAASSRKESSFPLKLHSILANPEFQEYITWLPNGRSWRILKPAAFERVVIPLVFRHAKYASFMRQVNGWGFKRITGGPASGAAHNSYYHQFFIREYPQLCLQMKRVGKTPSGNHQGSSEATAAEHEDHDDTSAVTWEREEVEE